MSLATRPDLEWEFFRAGVDRCWLYRATAEGPAAVLIRFQPGGRVPLHEHVGYEHIFVLSGAQQDENGNAEAGTLVVNPPGTRHSVISKDGCVVLVIYEKPVKFIEGF
ncbi:MAG TPA: cupin domain-containing protein [Candidatus Limnocylindria bacterium]|nr:cupin domain-containing protein [Candidatus Limnocylindria bacterium]